MAIQDEVNNATASLVASTTALKASTAQLVALGIQPPPDLTALNAAIADNSAAAAALQTQVSTEAGKVNPAPAS